jgi:hypothetical protein
VWSKTGAAVVVATNCVKFVAIADKPTTEKIMFYRRQSFVVAFPSSFVVAFLSRPSIVASVAFIVVVVQLIDCRVSCCSIY